MSKLGRAILPNIVGNVITTRARKLGICDRIVNSVGIRRPRKIPIPNDIFRILFQNRFRQLLIHRFLRKNRGPMVRQHFRNIIGIIAMNYVGAGRGGLKFSPTAAATAEVTRRAIKVTLEKRFRQQMAFLVLFFNLLFF